MIIKTLSYVFIIFNCYNIKRIFQTMLNFMVIELNLFYVNIKSFKGSDQC